VSQTTLELLASFIGVVVVRMSERERERKQ
jgi:hypothetical protein